MASPAVGRVALMSIHPEFASAILTGTKKVEFRKRPIANDVTHVIVYATAPVSAVVGAFTVENQSTAAVSSLWRRYAKVAGISRHRFFGYFADQSRGVGIQVGNVLAAVNPLSLDATLGVTRPPQSFQYLDPEVAEPALAEMRPVD
jgi:predicted transcriptional regulator